MTTKFVLNKLEASLCVGHFDILNCLGVDQQCDRWTDAQSGGQTEPPVTIVPSTDPH